MTYENLNQHQYRIYYSSTVHVRFVYIIIMYWSLLLFKLIFNFPASYESKQCVVCVNQLCKVQKWIWTRRMTSLASDDVYLVDDYDHASPMLAYAPENVPGRGCDEHLFRERLVGCSCKESSCNTKGCSCLRGHGPSYDAKGDLVGTIKTLRKGILILLIQALSHPYQLQLPQAGFVQRPLTECHDSCACLASLCSNRVIQRGPARGMEIREACGGKGAGLFCGRTTRMRRGQFVCCYAGEVLGEEEARRRLKAQDEQVDSSNYVLFADELREGDGARLNRTIVDPTAVGNVGRYANHSCSPNMNMHIVR